MGFNSAFKGLKLKTMIKVKDDILSGMDLLLRGKFC